MLAAFLGNYGDAHHIHSRRPPTRLCHAGGVGADGQPVYYEWFNDAMEMTDECAARATVVFIYRDPIYVLGSRFYCPTHRAHVQVTPEHTHSEISEQYAFARADTDVYGIEEFYDNYMKSATPAQRASDDARDISAGSDASSSIGRHERTPSCAHAAQYDVVAVKFEELYANIDALKQTLHLDPTVVAELPPQRAARTQSIPPDVAARWKTHTFKRLHAKMNAMPPICVIKKSE
jgi:hypothetical protein